MPLLVLGIPMMLHLSARCGGVFLVYAHPDDVWANGPSGLSVWHS